MKTSVLVPTLMAVLLPAGQAQVPYGTGTAGASGITPALSCGQPWMGNASFSLDVDDGLGGVIALLGVSFGQANGLFNGASLLIDLSPTQLALAHILVLSGPAGVPGAGSASLPFSLAVPVNPALAGLQLFAQAGLDEGGGTWATSPGLAIAITMPPRILVGTSVSGSTDPFYVVDPTTTPPTLATQFNVAGGPSAAINNCTAAAIARYGRRAYVGQAIGNAVQELDLDVSPPSWSPFYAALGSTYGIGVDDVGDRVYTLDGASSSSFELVAIDSAPGSPTYGQALASTAGLSGSGLIERWALSPDGRRAAVLTVLSRRLLLVDTDVASSGYMSWSLAGTAQANQAVFPVTTRCAFTPGGQQVLVTIQTGGGGVGEIARFDVGLGQWIDHDPLTPGIQNIGTQSAPPAAVPAAPSDVAVAGDGSFAIIVGWGGPGGIARIDLDPGNPQAWSFTLFGSSVSLANAARVCALSGDDSMVATYGSGMLLLFDTVAGTLQSQLLLPGTASVSSITWQ